MLMAKTNSTKQAEYRARMGAEHERFILWVPKDDYAELKAIAEAKGWINHTGRKAGQANMQQALVEAVKEGLATLRQQKKQ